MSCYNCYVSSIVRIYAFPTINLPRTPHQLFRAHFRREGPRWPVTTGGSSPLGVVPLNNLSNVNGGVAIFRYNSSVILISTNLVFPSSSRPNVSLILPSCACILRGRRGLHNVVIARNRRSRANSLPCLLRSLGGGIPVFSDGLALNFVRNGLSRFHVHTPGFHRIGNNDRIGLNNVSLSFFSVARSVPNTLNIFVHAGRNAIVRANSFGLSRAPVSNIAPSCTTVDHFTGRNVSLLLSSSAGTAIPNFAGSRTRINPGLLRTVGGTPNHIFITSFSDRVRHLRRVYSTTHGYNHGIIIANHSVLAGAHITHRLNCLGVSSTSVVSTFSVSGLPSSGVIIVYANSRNRPLSTLSHVTGNRRGALSVRRNSAIVLSTAPIPNGRGTIRRIIGDLTGLNYSI